MKKLLFLIPIACWTAAYFAFPLADVSTAHGTWWLLTSVALFATTLFSAIVAVAANT